MFWFTFRLFLFVSSPSFIFESAWPPQVNVTGTAMLVPPSFLAPSNYQPYYFDEFSMHKECAVLGVVSFCLTVVNILCIIISGTLVLKASLGKWD